MSEEIVGALIGLGGAVLGLLGGAVITLRTHRSQELRETAANFRDVLEKLIAARMESTRIWMEFRDPGLVSTKEALSGALNARRLLLKSTAAQMVDRIREDLLVNDYLVLGYELQLDSDFHRAAVLRTGPRRCPRRRDGRDQRPEEPRLAVSLRDPLPRPREGRPVLRAGARAVPAQHRRVLDLHHRIHTGELAWALVGANHPAGLDRVQQAAETYARMSTANPLRDSALAALEHRRALAEAGSSQPIAATETIGSGALRPTDVAQDRERSRPHG